MNRRSVAIRKAGAGLLPILLQFAVLAVGCYSVAGVCFSMLLLQIDWSVMAPALGCLCVLLYLVVRTRKSAHTRINILFLLGSYVLLVLRCRFQLIESLTNGMQGLFTHLNQTFHIYISLLPETEKVNRSIGLELFLAIFPLIVLTGYGILRKRSGILAFLYGLILVAACVIQIFPQNHYLLGMLLSLSSCIAGPFFAGKVSAGRKVSLISVFLCGMTFLAAEHMLPEVDAVYENTKEDRIALYSRVNQEWIPAIEERFNWKAMFRNSTVGGSLEQEDVYYTSAKLYRVTMDEKPAEVLYLKGFVGDVYTETTWEALGDEALEAYYQERGWEVPGDYAQIVNWTWKLARVQQFARQQHRGTQELEEELRKDCPQIEIAEIGGRNEYSLYPYGARLEDGTVHADGSQEWKGQICTYAYQSLRDYDGRAVVSFRDIGQDTYDYYMVGGGSPYHILGEQEKAMWQQYRQYVYDTYLEVPEERLSGLLSWAGQQDFPEYNGENIWQVTSSTLRALERTARYHLAEQEVLEGEDYIEAFLLRRKEGYCTHFASAEIMLLRLLGIPARYAAGYCVSPQDFVEKDGKYVAEVLDKQAHAWVEIYIDELGWVPLEATPGDVALSYDNRFELVTRVAQMSGNSYREEQGTDLRQEETETQTMEEPDKEDVKTAETEEPEEAKPPKEEIGIPEEKTQTVRLQSGLNALYIAAGLLLLGLVSRKLRQLVWRRRQRGEPIAAVRRLYRELLRMLSLEVSFSPELLEDCTWEEASDRIRQVVSAVSAEELALFLRLTEECSFGRRKPSSEELEAGYSLCRGIYRRLATSLPWYRRLALWAVFGNLFS